MGSVTRRTSRRREQRRSEILTELVPSLEAALADGERYVEITVGSLAKRAGISRSTFYAYVEDKGDILAWWFADVRTQLREASSLWWSLDADVEYGAVRDAVAAIISVYQPHAVMMAAVYDATSYDLEVRNQVTDLMTENIRALTSHIKAGQRGRWVASDVLPLETASWLMWMAERTQHQAVSTAGRAESEAHIDAFARIVWHSLYFPARVTAGPPSAQ